MPKFELKSEAKAKYIETSQVEFRDSLGLLKFELRPKRKRPDLTIEEASNQLANLVNEDHSYNFSNLLDVDLALKRLHELNFNQKKQFLSFITPESDKFLFNPGTISEQDTGIFSISLNMDRVSLVNNLSGVNQEIYSNLGFTYNSNLNQIILVSFYPNNATIRGYSIGKEIINKLEVFAKYLKVREIKVDAPTQDAVKFYTNIGFQPNGGKGLVKYISQN
ncbi:MAG: hypothetical protein OHK0017_06790 [Patescibacteria group bacterium]